MLNVCGSFLCYQKTIAIVVAIKTLESTQRREFANGKHKTLRRHKDADEGAKSGNPTRHRHLVRIQLTKAEQQHHWHMWGRKGFAGVFSQIIAASPGGLFVLHMLVDDSSSHGRNMDGRTMRLAYKV